MWPSPCGRAVFFLVHGDCARKFGQQIIHSTGSAFRQPGYDQERVAYLNSDRPFFVIIYALPSFTSDFITGVIGIGGVIEFSEPQVLSTNDALLCIDVPVMALIHNDSLKSATIVCMPSDEQQ